MSDAYNEGRDARGRGVPLNDCPHTRGTDERGDWRKGWFAGDPPAAKPVKVKRPAKKSTKKKS